MWYLLLFLIVNSNAFVIDCPKCQARVRRWATTTTSIVRDSSGIVPPEEKNENNKKRERHVVVIGGGWGGLSTAHTLSQQANEKNIRVTLIEAAPRVGGLVRDGFTTQSGNRPAEAGQHGFWKNYHNIFRLLNSQISNFNVDDALTSYAKQGQYSPRGLEAEWPVYKDQPLQLPTGLAQAAYTRFLNLSPLDRLSAFPLILAFSEFDDSPQAWERFDPISFRDLCIKLGVSKACYEEAFEPMILTALFAPGEQCSAAAALGMAYFFVLQSQTAFDVQWCRGNIGEVVFDPWVNTMEATGKVNFQTNTRVTGFDLQDFQIKRVKCQSRDGTETIFEADDVVFAVGAKALNAFVNNCPELATFPEFRNFANLRGTSVLATRIFLDKEIHVPYSANACWGFDEGVGMTLFDIKALHGNNSSTVEGAEGSVLEVDYYHASSLLVMSDDDILRKVKSDLDKILGSSCRNANVLDAAIVRLPNAVNWYYPGSYKYMPRVKSQDVDNLYFAGDIVQTRHGSWSQEKAFVTGMEAANKILGRPIDYGVLPVGADEAHVAFSKTAVALARTILGMGNPNNGPSLVDFIF